MKKKTVHLLLGLLLVVVAATACGKQETKSTVISEETEVAEDISKDEDDDSDTKETSEEKEDTKEEIEEEEELVSEKKGAADGALAPTPDEFADEYFGALTTYGEGVSGFTLKQAVSATEVITFASEHKIADTNTKEMRLNMLEGWDSLDSDDQKIFDENFILLCRLIDDCADNWESNKEMFADAGVDDVMETLLNDEDAMAHWDSLKSNTLTMGNSEE